MKTYCYFRDLFQPMDNIIYFIKSTLSNELAVSGFPLMYKGEMNHSMMRSFAFMVNKKITAMKIPTAARKRVFHVMIECLQNITKHSDNYDEQDKQLGNGLFVVGKDREAFYVITGNLVSISHMEALENRIVKLNTVNGVELKQMFIRQMVNGEITEKGGAGLGLIDIKRRSGKPLYYHFVPFSGNLYFFILAVTVPIVMEEEEAC